MERLVVFLALLTVVVSGDYVPGSYLVQMVDNTTGVEFINHIKKYSQHMMNKTTEWHIGSFSGYAAMMEPSIMKLVAADPLVKRVEPNYIAKLFAVASVPCTKQEAGSWGIRRVADGTAQGTTASIPANAAAQSDVTAYVLDSGVDCSHPLFGGRATAGRDFTGVNDPCLDGNGHGTHVAGIVGADKFGIARHVNIKAVKVVDSRGRGPFSQLADGVNYVAAECKGKKCVANMSLGDVVSEILNDACDALVDSGVAMIVAAGNENLDCRDTSPSSAKKVIPVGATGSGNNNGKETDVRTYYSNWGPHVKIFAPGEDIISLWSKDSSLGATENTQSGTSMACPLVTGMAAIYLAENPTATPAEIEQALIQQAGRPNIVMDCEGVCAQSPDLMLRMTPPCS